MPGPSQACLSHLRVLPGAEVPWGQMSPGPGPDPDPEHHPSTETAALAGAWCLALQRRPHQSRDGLRASGFLLEGQVEAVQVAKPLTISWLLLRNCRGVR